MLTACFVTVDPSLRSFAFAPFRIFLQRQHSTAHLQICRSVIRCVNVRFSLALRLRFAVNQECAGASVFLHPEFSLIQPFHSFCVTNESIYVHPRFSFQSLTVLYDFWLSKTRLSSSFCVVAWVEYVCVIGSSLKTLPSSVLSFCLANRRLERLLHLFILLLPFASSPPSALVLSGWRRQWISICIRQQSIARWRGASHVDATISIGKNSSIRCGTTATTKRDTVSVWRSWLRPLYCLSVVVYFRFRCFLIHMCVLGLLISSTICSRVSIVGNALWLVFFLFVLALLGSSLFPNCCVFGLLVSSTICSCVVPSQQCNRSFSSSVQC